MNPTITKRSLTPARRRLVELMQYTYYGRIERLVIRDGEPVLDPPPKIVRVRKTTGSNSGDPSWTGQDFSLRAEVINLLAYLDELKCGVIQTIEIRRGLPCEIIVEENIAA